MKPTKFIIAGHSVQTPGAIAYNGKTEHEYNVELQQLIVQGMTDSECLSGTSFEVKTDSERSSNYQVRQMINTYATKGSRGCDIHFNNNNPRATGVEVVVSPHTTSENKARANRTAERISKCLDITHRKRVPSRGYIYPTETFVGKLPILSQTKIPMILIEVCFLNENDLAKYEPKKHEVADIVREEMGS